MTQIFSDYPEYRYDIKPKWEKRNGEILSAGNENVTDEGFLNNGFKISSIPESIAIELLKSLELLPRIKYAGDDFNDRYIGTVISHAKAEAVAKGFPNFDFKEEQLALVKLICEEVRPVVEACLGTGFTVVNVRGQQTLPETGDFGPNKIHTDSSLPKGIYKVLMYLTEAGMTCGTTHIPFKRIAGGKIEHAYVIGPPGTYLFFDPINRAHHGIPQESGIKSLLEITVVPSYVTEINPTFNGTNSIIPIELC